MLPDLDMPLLHDATTREWLRGRMQSMWASTTAVERAIDEAVDWHAKQREPVQVFVAVHHGNFPQLEYLAHGLRSRGIRTLAFYLRTAPPSETFDRALSLGGSLGALYRVAARLPAGTSIYLQAHGRWTFLAQLLAASGRAHTVVQELWDWMELFIGDASVFIDEGVFEAAEIAVMLQSERFIRHHCAGFLYKDDGEPMQALLGDATAPSRQFVPSPPRAWMKAPMPRRAGEPWRLVHAGQIRSASDSRRVFGDLHYIPVIRALTEQGFHVAAYPSAVTPGTDPLADYVAETQCNPRFRLERSLPIRELITALHHHHDVGLLTYRLPPELGVGRAHMRSGMASKLFTYLAAGLPVVVTPEFEAIATLVRRHGLGWVVPFEELSSLHTSLTETAFAACLERIANAQSQLCLDRKLDELIDFVRDPSRHPRDTLRA